MNTYKFPSNLKPFSVFKTCIWLFLLAIFLIPTQKVQADVGPKPGEDFDFFLEEGLSLTIVDGQLLQCKDRACRDAQPLQKAGPQHFTCQQARCESMAYGYSEYQKISITFSDGKTRQSNIFGKKYFGAHYHVTVQRDDLLVEEQRGSINPLTMLFIWIIVAGIVGLVVVAALLVILATLINRARQDKANFQQSRGLFILVWVLSLLLTGLGSYFSLSIFITAVIEAVLGVVYAAIKKYPKLTMFTMVLLANMLTQMGLLLSIQAMQSGFNWPVTIAAEIAIWFVEGLILYGTQIKRLSIKEAMGISLLLNGVSFWVGLLMRL